MRRTKTSIVSKTILSTMIHFHTDHRQIKLVFRYLIWRVKMLLSVHTFLSLSLGTAIEDWLGEQRQVQERKFALWDPVYQTDGLLLCRSCSTGSNFCFLNFSISLFHKINLIAPLFHSPFLSFLISFSVSFFLSLISSPSQSPSFISFSISFLISFPISFSITFSFSFLIEPFSLLFLSS